MISFSIFIIYLLSGVFYIKVFIYYGFFFGLDKYDFKVLRIINNYIWGPISVNNYNSGLL